MQISIAAPTQPRAQRAHPQNNIEHCGNHMYNCGHQVLGVNQIRGLEMD